MIRSRVAASHCPRKMQHMCGVNMFLWPQIWGKNLTQLWSFWSGIKLSWNFRHILMKHPQRWKTPGNPDNLALSVLLISRLSQSASCDCIKMSFVWPIKRLSIARTSFQSLSEITRIYGPKPCRDNTVFHSLSSSLSHFN